MTPSKKIQKEAFQRKVGFRVDSKIPLFVIPEKVDVPGQPVDPGGWFAAAYLRHDLTNGDHVQTAGNEPV